MAYEYREIGTHLEPEHPNPDRCYDDPDWDEDHEVGDILYTDVHPDGEGTDDEGGWD